ncbi:MAG: hypothetical protein LDLANPLL_01668 [Turneriella sp.]|nr:hypothetical protein [Turneriella sp.]
MLRVHWLGKSILSVFITGVLAAAVWLFWGDSLRKLWNTKKIESVVKEKAKQKAEKISTKINPKLDSIKKELPSTKKAEDEWKKAQNGFLGVVAAERKNYATLFSLLNNKNDTRWRSIFAKNADKAPVK